MGIQNLDGVNNILNSYNSEQWVKSADFEANRPLDFNDESFKNLNFSADDISGKSFGEFLKGSVMEINKLQEEANLAMQNLATGKSKNIHETMIAVEKAEIAFKTMNQIRTKVIDAYKEIMRMQM